MPLTPALSPRAGRGRDPWRIRDAPPDRRTHACAERGGRVRGSGRRIWADLPRRTPFYIFTAFIFSYGTTVLHSSRDLLLIALLSATVLSFVMVPLSGYLSDRVGRKRFYLIGAVTMGVWGFIYFALLNTAIPGWIFLAVVLSLVPHDMMWGPQAALIAECFTPRLRYSGFSLGFHLSSITAGGPAPLIATALLAVTGSGYVIALYILFCAVVTVASTIFLPDHTNR